MKTEFVIRVSEAHQPSSRKWQHRRTRVAVLEVEPGTVPAMISERARGVVRVVRVWEDLYTGPSQHCQYACAMRAARDLAGRLSAAQS